MSDTTKNILFPVLGFVGHVIVLFLVGFVLGLLDIFIAIEFVGVLILGGLVTVGAIVWYRKYRRDQKWIRENQDLITGRRHQRAQAKEE